MPADAVGLGDVLLVLPGPQGLRVPLVLRVRQALRVLLVRQALRVLRALRALRVLRVLPGLRVLLKQK